MEFKDYFLIIWALGMIIIPICFWREGRAGFWKIMREKFLFKGPNSDFPNTNRSAERFYYREQNKKWKSWNLFNINFDENGMYIKSLSTSFLFPSVYIPWQELVIKEITRYRLQKRIMLSFKNYDGELAIPVRHERVINKYVH